MKRISLLICRLSCQHSAQQSFHKWHALLHKELIIWKLWGCHSSISTLLPPVWSAIVTNCMDRTRSQNTVVGNRNETRFTWYRLIVIIQTTPKILHDPIICGHDFQRITFSKSKLAESPLGFRECSFITSNKI